MKFTNVFLLIVMLSFLSGCASVKQKPILTPEIDIESVYTGIQTKYIERAIIEACNNRGWKIDERANNYINASLVVRGKHLIALHIPYSNNFIRFEYKDSSNMLYTDGNPPKIHHNYNNWVKNLVRDINMRLTAFYNSKAMK